LILPGNAPGRVLQAVRDGRLIAVASWELVEELADVLRRPKPRRYDLSEGDLQSVLVLLAPLLPSVEVGIEIRDPKDAPVVAAAVAGRADAIVTGDRDLLDDLELRNWLRERGIELSAAPEILDRLD
jgi:putative PIN family toxin of toxin-antitoxin system